MATSSTAWRASGATISIPGKTTVTGNRVYGRGTADNKGQHSINMAALRAVREARGGKLGFNANSSSRRARRSARPICGRSARRIATS